MNINWKYLILSIGISVGIGMIAAVLTMNSMEIYHELTKPVFSPPSWLFSVVWGGLYILMGVSAYLIYLSDESQERKQALSIYGIQLLVNFCWPIVFFIFHQYLWAFIVLVILWVFILLMLLRFAEINRAASKLQIPYFIWVTFAGYLNLMIYLLNK